MMQPAIANDIYDLAFKSSDDDAVISAVGDEKELLLIIESNLARKVKK
jgi:hypothetical protein